MRFKVFQWLLCLFATSLSIPPASAQSSPPAVLAPPIRDGAHDFDPLLGNFNYHLRRLVHPLSGSTDWTDLTGTGSCYRVWDGRAQLDTLEVDGSSGHIEGLTLRLYDATSHQWRLYWANSRIGRLDPPQIGDFRDGHGDFYTTDTINGKTTLIRYDWSRMTSGGPHFEQAFSADGGMNWEVNWITEQTRTGDAIWGQPQPLDPRTPTASTGSEPASTSGDGAHDFDFDHGTWKIHIRRRLHPLTGSDEWTEMEGTSITHPIWNGGSNLSVVEADGSSGHLELLALRLYDPHARQWNISFATSNGGILSVPAVGQFFNGRGAFYDSELFHGRSILVRFTISAISANEIHSEQAFSVDGGSTWEINWINTFTRASGGGA